MPILATTQKWVQSYEYLWEQQRPFGIFQQGAVEKEVVWSEE